MTVFTFGSTHINTFEEHKRAFSNKYYGAKDMNYNHPSHLSQPPFVEKLGKTVDFHEDVLKQVYTTIKEHDYTIKNLRETISMMNTRINKLESDNKVLHEHNSALREHVDFLMVEDKKREEQEEMEVKKERYIELMKEIREIENDMKFWRKEN